MTSSQNAQVPSEEKAFVPGVAPRARRLRELLKQSRDLSHAIEREFQRQYPEGCHVHWDHGQQLRHGYVIRHGYGFRALIRAPSSKQVWVDGNRFLELKS